MGLLKLEKFPAQVCCTKLPVFSNCSLLNITCHTSIHFHFFTDMALPKKFYSLIKPCQVPLLVTLFNA